MGELLTLEHKLKVLPRQIVRHGNATILVVGAFSAIAAGARRSWDPWRVSRWEPRAIALVGLLCGALVVATVGRPHHNVFRAGGRAGRAAGRTRLRRSPARSFPGG